MGKSTCSFEGCENPARAGNLCNGHYQQHRKGQALRPMRSQITLEQRFWAKVKKTESCWLWTAAADSHGYGLIWVDGQMRRAHRLAWELENDSIPVGMFIDHRCANRKCVNPGHLRVVTISENNQHFTGPQKNTTSGLRGVSWDKHKNGWRAYATLNGRQHSGGLHSTIESADAAARALRAQLYTHDDHDEWLKRAA